jgi:hypothetical protein
MQTSPRKRMVPMVMEDGARTQSNERDKNVFDAFGNGRVTATSSRSSKERPFLVFINTYMFSDHTRISSSF